MVSSLHTKYGVIFSRAWYYKSLNIFNDYQLKQCILIISQVNFGSYQAILSFVNISNVHWKFLVSMINVILINNIHYSIFRRCICVMKLFTCHGNYFTVHKCCQPNCVSAGPFQKYKRGSRFKPCSTEIQVVINYLIFDNT